MKEIIVSVNHEDISNPAIYDIRKLILKQFEAVVDKALANGEVNAEMLAVVGIKYFEDEYEFPNAPLLVRQNGRDYVRCSLELWYGTNVSIPNFYVSQFEKKVEDFASRVEYEHALRIFGCWLYIHDVNRLINSEIDVIDYGLLQIRRVPASEMMYNCTKCRFFDTCLHVVKR